MNKDSGKSQFFLDLLKDNIVMFGMLFRLSKCKLLLQGWICSELNPLLAEEHLGYADTFSCSGSCASPGCNERSLFVRAVGLIGIC